MQAKHCVGMNLKILLGDIQLKTKKKKTINPTFECQYKLEITEMSRENIQIKILMFSSLKAEPQLISNKFSRVMSTLMCPLLTFLLFFLMHLHLMFGIKVSSTQITRQNIHHALCSCFVSLPIYPYTRSCTHKAEHSFLNFHMFQ